jgi:ribose transport system ATP-binding protein
LNNEVLEMTSITKHFPGVTALDDVSINLRAGEVLGLLGENGAGKSTLIKILSGAYSLEEGSIYIDGVSFSFANPGESRKHGVRVIYQELSSFDPITVAENIFAGEHLVKKTRIINWPAMIRQSREALSRLNSSIDPSEIMENLSVAEKQIVEIAKAVHTKAKIIVMDEPTSALNEQDVNTLYTIIRQLKSEGIAVIYITHKLVEIFDITDRVVVLRDGKKVGDSLTNRTDRKELLKLIVGKSLSELYPKRRISKGKSILEVKNLFYLDKLKDITFTLHEGEIVAFFGLLGSGIQILFNVIFGDLRKTSGIIVVNGEPVNINHPAFAKEHGLGFVPIDRKDEGVALDLDVESNIIISNIEKMGKGLRLDKKQIGKRASYWIERLGIKTPNSRTNVKSLSGGNQQKIVVSKWLERNSKILLMAEPTRGIDVGAKAEIYSIAEDICEKGAGVALVSSELPEIMAISDRIIVLKEGSIVGQFITENTTAGDLMRIVTA